MPDRYHFFCTFDRIHYSVCIQATGKYIKVNFANSKEQI